jgi:antirestriction protein ArdC
MNKSSAPFAELLNEALTVPGILSQAYSMFHNYSIGNQMWVMCQMHARKIPVGPVGTYKKWGEFNRTVKKGEKALSMIMPVVGKTRDKNGEEDSFVFFTVKNLWFAVSQTEGDDYTQETIIPEWDANLAYEKLDIKEIPFQMTDGNCMGYAKGRSIAISPVAEFPHKTRFHEIAHIVLGHTAEHGMDPSEHTPRDIREVEAETVAYILCSILGLTGLEESRGYIQSWFKNGTMTDKTAQRIFNAANKILNAGKRKEETE